MEIETKHLQFKHPSNILVSGPSGSGKTQLIRNIIKKFDVFFYNLNKKEINILWAYGQWQPFIDVQLSKHTKIKFIQKLPTEKDLNNVDIVVIDDLMHEMSNTKDFENIFIKKSHHLNITVFFLVQNLFYNAKSMRTISLNSHYIILMKNPRDTQQVMQLSRQMFPSYTKYFIEAFNDATQPAYGYIRIDLTPDTPENLRLTTRIENPIIYVKKPTPLL